MSSRKPATGPAGVSNRRLSHGSQHEPHRPNAGSFRSARRCASVVAAGNSVIFCHANIRDRANSFTSKGRAHAKGVALVEVDVALVGTGYRASKLIGDSVERKQATIVKLDDIIIAERSAQDRAGDDLKSM